MGYTSREIVANALDGNQTSSIASWRAHYLELHDLLLASGWVQTDDSGQLDIASVVAMPGRDVYVGYRMYEIDDDLSAAGYKIYMKLEFGGYSETSNTSQHNTTSATGSIKTSFGMKTDGAGGLLSQSMAPLTPAPIMRHPASLLSEFNNNISFSRPVLSYSYCCKNDDLGFFGLMFACNQRGWASQSSSRFNAASLSVILQRTLDDSGVPTGDGFTVYVPRTVASDSRWPLTMVSSTAHNITCGYSYSSNTIQSTFYSSPRPAGLNGEPISGRIQIGPTYSYVDASLKFNPNLVTYRTADITEGSQFEVEVAPGDFRNFIALGPGTGQCPDQFGPQNSFAMLYE